MDHFNSHSDAGLDEVSPPLSSPSISPSLSDDAKERSKENHHALVASRERQLAKKKRASEVRITEAFSFVPAS